MASPRARRRSVIHQTGAIGSSSSSSGSGSAGTPFSLASASASAGSAEGDHAPSSAPAGPSALRPPLHPRTPVAPSSATASASAGGSGSAGGSAGSINSSHSPAATAACEARDWVGRSTSPALLSLATEGAAIGARPRAVSAAARRYSLPLGRFAAGAEHQLKEDIIGSGDGNTARAPSPKSQHRDCRTSLPGSTARGGSTGGGIPRVKSAVFSHEIHQGH